MILMRSKTLMTKGPDMRGEMEQSQSWIEVSKLKQTRPMGLNAAVFEIVS